MGGTPAGDSPHSAWTKMGQKMSLAHRRLSLLDDGSRISSHIAAAAAAADDDGGGSEQMVRTLMEPSDFTFLHLRHPCSSRIQSIKCTFSYINSNKYRKPLLSVS